ncbi:MAG: DUF29 domain-containing protein [Cyanobacterium sp. T60_A2020_053]|nr:DUF29 domain-containing protein [Cyanobacterium sp. T60_A2020_053]
MVRELIKEKKNLYENDYNLWILETVNKLKNQDFNSLDLENLIEEVLDLSKRDKRKLESLLMKLIEHLLILSYWQTEKTRNQGHWQKEIFSFRKQINRLLTDSPSLKNYLEKEFYSCYQDGRKMASQHSLLVINTFPEEPFTTLANILDENWLP